MIGRAKRTLGRAAAFARPAPALRRGRPRDAAALAAILSDWIDATPWMPRIHSRAEDRAHVARLIAEMEVLVAGRPARGFLARRAHFVHSLYIAPQARGQGLGRRLLTAAKADCARLELWTFQANLPARAFYARNGFAEVELTDGAGNDEGLPDVRLCWRRPGEKP